jgi:hypothetical protein
VGGQYYKVDPANEGIIRFGQRRGSAFLDQPDHTIIALDLEFFLGVRHNRRSLNFRHTIGQDLSHDAFFRADRARIETILHRASKRDHTYCKDRYAKQDFVQRESPTNAADF